MIFKKKTHQKPPPAAVRTATTTDGFSALAEVAAVASDVIGLHPFSHATPLKNRLREIQKEAAQNQQPSPLSHEAHDAPALLGFAAGMAVTGSRATAFTDSAGLLSLHGSLHSMAAKRLPVVICAACEALEKQGAAALDGHAAYHAISDSGAFQLFAQNVQQAADFLLIAQHVAGQTLTPAIVAFDCHATGLSAQSVVLPDAALVAKFLGSSREMIDTPTPAQTLLFGEQRRRVPEMLSLDHAIGIGATQSAAGYAKGLAAQQPFFFAHVAGVLEHAFAEFAKMTGRHYAPLFTEHIEKAELVLIAQGAAVLILKNNLDAVQKATKAKIGMIGISQLRPFPGAQLSQLLKGKKAVAILERMDEPLAEALPLARELQAVLQKAIENGRSRSSEPVLPNYAAFDKPTDGPALFSAVYLQAFSENDMRYIVQNMLPKGEKQKLLYLGVPFKIAQPRSPKLEMLQQQLLRHYPHLENLAAAPPDEAATPSTQPKQEPETPWTVQRVKKTDGRLFDLARLWDSAGFLYETDEAEQTLADPFIASGAIPAGSSAFKKAVPGSQKIIRLIPENLHEIDLPQLLAYAPEAGLQATVQGLPAIFETAIRLCEARGHTFLQVPRLSTNLLKIAYRLLVNDDLQKYLYAGALLGDAFAELMEKMNPNAQQRSTFEQEIEAVLELLATYVIVKTERFFEQEHRREKGSGLLLSLAINPDAAVDASACLAHCPPNTMELAESTEAVLADARKNRQILYEMPEIPFETIESWIDAARPETTFFYFLQPKVYHAMLLSTGDPPAFGARVAMHLTAAAVEAVMQPRFRELTEKISTLIAKLEEKIQGGLSDSLKINDFEAFGRRLREQTGQPLDLSKVAALVSDDHEAHRLDQQRLARLSSLHATLAALRTDFAIGANGDGRARMAAVFAMQHAGASFAVYPYNPFPFPWLQQLDSDAAMQATGLFVGLAQKMSETFKAMRMAELELADDYSPDKHDRFFEQFSWHDLNEAEQRLCPPVLVVTDEVARFDPISKLLQSGLPIKILVINHRGPGLPDSFAAMPSPQPTGTMPQIIHNEPGLTALLHRQSFVLQTSIGDPAHLFRGALQGMQFAGPALLHVYAPDLRAQGASAIEMFDLAKLAVASRSFPVFLYQPGHSSHWGRCLDLHGNPEKQNAWVAEPLQVTQPSGLVDKLPRHLTPADWAAQIPGFETAFTLSKPKAWHDAMAPLVDYLVLSPDQRQGREPFIAYTDQKMRLNRLIVSTAMVKLVEERQQFWTFLRHLTQLESSTADEIDAQVQARLDEELQRAKAKIVEEYEARLAALQNEHDRLYHARLTQKLLALSGFRGDAERLKKSLQEFAKINSENNGDRQ